MKMNKETLGTYVLTEEEREILRNDIIALLEEYDYNPTKYAVNKIIDEWVKNKGWMINLFKKHPNYNGKFQIVFDSDYDRVCDRNILCRFSNYLHDNADFINKEKQIGVFSYREVKETYDKIKNVLYDMDDIMHQNYHVLVNGKTYEQMQAEKEEWYKKHLVYVGAQDRSEIVINGAFAFEPESFDNYLKIKNITNLIGSYVDHIATEEFVNKINYQFPSVKAVVGQKTSRIIGKIAKITGMDKHPEWNREYSKYCDAINPLAIKRHTILSCHPIDYFTMSFGNSWASCHTIDKKNKRNMPNDYSGCYSSGTLSYMLDGSSFVFYTVDKKYDGNVYELEPKINRNMFHMGEDKLIQARVYPQATDGETGIYRQIREIAQKVVADCLDVPNLWKNVKGTSECNQISRSYGTHYRDYANYNDCNVSYLKNDESENVNVNIIFIGHDPICPNCGDTHDYAEAIECEGCYGGEVCCADCGDYHDTDNMHYIDGEYYCENCCFWCEYHEEYEIGDYTYIEDYGRVCDTALEYGDFYRCEYCNEWYYTGSRCDEHIETEDGTHFCCADHAMDGGYVETRDGEWHEEGEVRYCEHCYEYVHVDEWNDEHECCNDCVPEETESEEE